MDEVVIINLINTVIRHGQASTWCNSEIIEQLIDCGLTEKDFIKYGFGDFVADYFKNPDEDLPKMSTRDFIKWRRSL